MNVLKNLKTIYGRALNSNKWHVALQAVEQQAKYRGLFEGQHPPSQRPPVTEQQYSNFMDALEKLDAGLEHPPP